MVKDIQIGRETKSLKSIALIEFIIILILAGILLKIYLDSNNQSYCEKHYDDTQQCMLSSKIYTQIIQPENYMILNFDPLKTNIQNYINSTKINASVYVVNLRDSANMGINTNQQYDAVSLNKLMVAMIIMKKIENGELSLKTPLPILPEDRNDLSGTLYGVNVDYATVKDLLRYLLSESDNTAFNVLSKQITINNGKDIIDYLGYYKDIYLNDSVSPTEFLVTPKSVGNIFLSLYFSTTLKPEDSEMILKFLANNTYDINKYAHLPEKVIVSQKFGSFHLIGIDLFHSCGIMYIRDSRIMYCIMTRGLDEEKGQQAVGDMVNKIYNFVIDQKKLQNITI